MRNEPVVVVAAAAAVVVLEWAAEEAAAVGLEWEDFQPEPGHVQGRQWVARAWLHRLPHGWPRLPCLPPE